METKPKVKQHKIALAQTMETKPKELMLFCVVLPLGLDSIV